MSESPHQRTRITGPLIGATVVLIFGALGCSIMMAAAGSDPIAALGIFFIGLALIGMMLWLLRATPEMGASMYDWVKSRRSRPAPLAYEPELRAAASKRFGTNAPPTIDQVRDLKDGLNTWVPSGDQPISKPSRRRT